MSLVIADRVKETSLTTGSGNFTLNGASNGFQSFNSAIGVGNTCYYIIENPSAGEWEIGIGTLNASTTLARTTILKSSNSNTVVTFSAGTKNVFVTAPADQINNLASKLPTYGGAGTTNPGSIIYNDGNNLNINNAIALIWGVGWQGSFGNNTTGSVSSPVQVIGDDWIYLDASQSPVGLKSDGSLWTWGVNWYGQLGDNTTVSKSSPVQTVVGGYDWVAAATDGNSCAGIKGDGSLWLWGNNGYGQLGDDTTVNKSSPVQTIIGGYDWVDIKLSNNSSVALKRDGSLWTWGGNYYGQLGDGTTVNKSSPVQTIAGGVDWRAISASASSIGVIKSDGTIWAWGNNTYGQLGDNTTVNKSSPVQLTGGTSGWTDVKTGQHTVALKDDGSLWSWGLNDAGQLGDDTTVNRSSPIQTLAGGYDWAEIACVGNDSISGSTFADKTDGSLWSWGLNSAGQLGIGDGFRSSPVQIAAAGSYFSPTGRNGTVAILKRDKRHYQSRIKLTGPTLITLPQTGVVLSDTQAATITHKLLGNDTIWNGTVIDGQYGGTGVVNAGKTITIGGDFTTSGAYSCTITLVGVTSVTLPTTGTIATLDSTMTGIWNGTVIAGQYGGTGVANTGKTITLSGNFATSGAYACTLTLTGITSVTLPTTGTIATLDGTMTGTWNGTVIAGQYGGTGVANTGKTITLGGNFTTSGAFATTLTVTAATTVTLPITGTLATLAGAETFTNKTLSTGSVWNGGVIVGQYGGTGVANTGKTITLGGNFTTSGAFATTLTVTAATAITLPTTGTVATLAGAETFTNKTLSTSSTWNGNVIASQYGGTGVANTGKTITIGGNFATSGAYACTFTLTNTTSITLPTTGTVATLAGVETFSSKVITLSAGTTSVAPLVFTSGTNKTTPSAGCVEFDGNALYFTPSTVRKTVAFIDSTMTGVWNGTAVGLTYGGTGATTQAGAANAVLPSQTSNSGKFLTTDGSNVSWASAGLAITNDTSTSATRYVTFTSSTSGSATVLNTSSSRLTFNPGTGDLFVWGNVQANSDRRLKTNIVKIADAGAKVRLLNGVEFDWIESGSHSQGLIAQDVEVVAPELVIEANGFKSVAYSNLVGLLVEAVKELQDEVANLKKQLGV